MVKNKIDEQYINLIKDVLSTGTKKQTRNGDVLSVFGRTITYDFTDNRFPLLTTKKMYFKGIVTELLWFLRGDTNIKFLIDNDCHIWDGDCYQSYLKNIAKDINPLTKDQFINNIKTNNDFALKWGDLGKIYGFQWRNWELIGDSLCEKKSFDQFNELINELKINPDSRRLIVSAWNAGQVFDNQMVLPPCHYAFQLYTKPLSVNERFDLIPIYYPETFDVLDFNIPSLITHETIDNLYPVPKRSISLKWDQRSVDLGLGLPFNIASYALLLEIIGKIVNMVPDKLIGNLGDVHIYTNHIDGLSTQLNREPYDLPKLNIVKEKSFWLNELNDIIFNLETNDFLIEDYKSHPTIKMPLSN